MHLCLLTHSHRRPRPFPSVPKSLRLPQRGNHHPCFLNFLELFSIATQAPRPCDDIWSVGASLFACVSRSSPPFPTLGSLLDETPLDSKSLTSCSEAVRETLHRTLRYSAAKKKLRFSEIPSTQPLTVTLFFFSSFLFCRNRKPQPPDTEMGDTRCMLERVLILRGEMVYHVFIASAHTAALSGFAQTLTLRLRTERVPEIPTRRRFP